jgi:hypothetical protein
MSKTIRLVPAKQVFPGQPARWVTTHCRVGNIPGARKFGAIWFVDLDVFEASQSPVEVAATSIEADIRARFRCAS